ncbi:phosphoribosylglycinamide formyltransferase, chloroplastic [Andrographis paniculata]|uniref:phosphoribosylglycinamide formyltransferase, chloroplastic n=1 Tax=Andrographis paniculata TaxID=175694 RepID=UPI0021E7E81D|nr:phosphoribosylglycinamide formyltransferase, chloroplastic [Andrographis paniculata]
MEAQNAIIQALFRPAASSSEVRITHSLALPSRLPARTRITLGNHSFCSNSLLVKRPFRCEIGAQKDEHKTVSDVGEGNAKAKIRRKKLAVFVSGGGSNFRSIHEATVSGSVHGEVVVLVASKHDCGGAEYARGNGIPVIVFPTKKDTQKGFSAEDLVSALRSLEVDFILLAGYLKLIPTELVQAYPRAILNIHPSLLPSFGGKGFYGLKVHKAVIACGARYSGPTIHYVDEHYDTGRILAQRVVPVLANDTAEELAARVLHEEHQLYVEVLQALCEDRITWREDGVPLIRSKENPDEYW